MFCFLNSNVRSEEWGGMGGKFNRLHATCSPAPLQSRSTHSLRKSLLVNIPEPVEPEKSLRYGFSNWTQKASLDSSKIFLRYCSRVFYKYTASLRRTTEFKSILLFT